MYINNLNIRRCFHIGTLSGHVYVNLLEVAALNQVVLIVKGRYVQVSNLSCFVIALCREAPSLQASDIVWRITFRRLGESCEVQTVDYPPYTLTYEQEVLLGIINLCMEEIGHGDT